MVELGDMATEIDLLSISRRLPPDPSRAACTNSYTAAMARPIVLGVVGDSASGKTTLTRGLIRVMGEDQVVRISADDYHVHERRERRAVGTTPLDPGANHIDILTQHLVHLRRGEAVLKPVYDHRNGTLGPPEYVRGSRYLVVEGLLNFHTEALRTAHDVRVYMAPPRSYAARGN